MNIQDRRQIHLKMTGLAKVNSLALETTVGTYRLAC